MAVSAGSVCQVWKRFDLQQLQKDLDAALTTLTTTQHENEETRQKLIDQSQEIKKHTAEELHEHVAPLLQGFQSEIDVLCERSKESEAAFLSVYKRLIDVPDPVGALEAVQQLQLAVVKMRDVETENQKLREKLQEYSSEVAQVNGHNKEVVIKALTEKLESYERLIQTETKDEDQHSNGARRERASTVEVTRLDVDRANQRAEAAEREVESLREQLSSRMHRTQNEVLEAELVTKKREVERLMSDVQKLQTSLKELSDSTANQIRELQQQLDSKHTLLEELEEKLEAQADYEDLRRKLGVLKSVEHSSKEDSRDGDGVQKGPMKRDLTGSVLIHRGLPATPVPAPLHTPPAPQIARGKRSAPESARPFSTSFLASHFSTSFPQLAGRIAVNSLLQRQLSHNFFGKNAKEEGADVELGAEPDPDTAEIARHVKEQLIKHNIGQRVFGHYVLGLSQGSVSEILSRPKPWSKLTVRGKEPFHKMRQFLSDEQNILALRSIQGRQRGNITTRVRAHESNSDETVKSLLDQTKRELQVHKGERVPSSFAGSADESASSGHMAPGAVIIPDLSLLSPKLLGPAISVLPYSPIDLKVAKTSLASPLRDSWREQWWSAICTERHEATPTPQDDKEIPARLGSVAPVASVVASLDCWKDQSSSESQRSRNAEPGVQVSNGNEPHSSPLPPFSSSSSSSSSSPHLGISKSAKVAVTALTPEQYERFMYQDVDTAELTQQVKERLAKNGICQRVFGEKVLGLSQGSVSDMLSRPKQWNKLTQKGREPFIRMQLWIDGELQEHGIEAAPKALASCSPAPDSPASSIEELVRDQPKEAEPESQQDGAIVQEMVAASNELDTYSITKRIKEVLIDNNLGQRLFGESVLGLTQGSVSDLLARPKPWHKLSAKGREPFVRMQLWLNDQNNIHKLREAKHTEKKAGMKRRHSSACESPLLEGAACVREFGGSPQLKRSRVVLAPEEKEALKRAYEERPYPSPGTIEELSHRLSLRPSTVVNWFHNYRSRIRRELFLEEVQAAAAESCGATEGQTGAAQEPREVADSPFAVPELAAAAVGAAHQVPRDSSLRRKKAANLNSIIHRLEKAANRDEAQDGCESAEH